MECTAHLCSFKSSTWQELLGVLTRESSNEAISGDVAEAIGYDRIDLVSEILSKRAEFAQEVGQHIVSFEAFALILACADPGANCRPHAWAQI